MDRAELGSLHFSRTETERLLAALFISLCLHLAAWGGYELGKKLNWWQSIHLPVWLHRTVKTVPPPKQAPPETEVQPTIFVDVTDPDAKPPQKTPYYSYQNSHAANPDEDKNSNQPKLNGHQKDVPQTHDDTLFSKLQPSPQPPQPQVQAAAPQSSPLNLGDIKSKPQTDNQQNGQDNQPQPQSRPRTLKEALAQRHMPSRQLQQDGGVRRHRLVPSFDVTASPFGDYDSALIAAVTQRWYDILDSQQFAEDRTGVVTLKFKLMYDGSIRDMTEVKSSVGELLSYVCQESIESSAPFGKWPQGMEELIGKNYREITFSFYYY